MLQCKSWIPTGRDLLNSRIGRLQYLVDKLYYLLMHVYLRCDLYDGQYMIVLHDHFTSEHRRVHLYFRRWRTFGPLSLSDFDQIG